MARRLPAARFLRLFHHQQRMTYSAPSDGQIPNSKQKYIPSTGTYPIGFSAGTAHAGVKASNTRFDDIAIFSSDRPCSAAAVFTQNRFQAAPVTVSRGLLKQGGGTGVRGVVVNSGCANAVTGKGGLEDAHKMAKAAGEALRQDEPLDGRETNGDDASTLVMSTGVIGQRLPMDRILPALPHATKALGSTHDHYLRAARAICTTDTFPKLTSHAFTLPSHPNITFHLTGNAKGAGMIHPNMATLLSILMTDAPVTPDALHTILARAVSQSFNSISIDGDTSTNDTVALFANGAAASASPLYKGRHAGIVTDADSADGRALQDVVTAVATQLAQLVVRDGEGATKFVTVRVRGAQERWIRHRVASSVARSPLVKTALYGRDANWGRILCAVGYCDGLPETSVRPEEVGVSFVSAGERRELKLLVDGEPIPGGVDEAAAARLLAEEDLEILIRLDDQGDEAGHDDVLFWTCDFSHEYVTINGDYRT